MAPTIILYVLLLAHKECLSTCITWHDYIKKHREEREENLDIAKATESDQE
jgi:hypothetical protein